MKLNNIFKSFAIGCALASAASQAKKPAPISVPLTTKITVVSVDVAARHAYTGPIGKFGIWGKHTKCEKFTGTFEGNDVHVKIEAKGGSGSYRHRIVTTFGDSYRMGKKKNSQIDKRTNGNGTVQISIPEISDGVSFVQQTILLVTTDSEGHTATDNVIFTVSRPVMVSPSQNADVMQTKCYQRYRPYPAMTGVLSNATNNLSEIGIEQGLEKILTTTNGWQFGVFVSPLSVLGLGNLVVFNYSYFHETSKSTIETTKVNTKFSLDPGDFMQVYAQPTRYVTPYDATLVDACGERTTIEGAYHFQTWGFSYLVHPVNPNSKELPDVNAIGAPVDNTCPPEFNPDNAISSSALPVGQLSN